MVSEYILDMCVRLWWWIGSFVFVLLCGTKEEMNFIHFLSSPWWPNSFFLLFLAWLFFSFFISFCGREYDWKAIIEINLNYLSLSTWGIFCAIFSCEWVCGGGEILAIITYLRFVNIWVSFGEWVDVVSHSRLLGQHY